MAKATEPIASLGVTRNRSRLRGSSSLSVTVTASQPRNSPETPPIKPMNPDSLRNCPTIWPSEAPMALRTPISRVRSFTDMVMVLMTESPPTKSAMIAIP